MSALHNLTTVLGSVRRVTATSGIPVAAEHARTWTALAGPVPEAANVPLVSCVMPTRDRHSFVPHAIRCFLGQDYPATELVVVDDGAKSVHDLIPTDPRIRYLRLPETRSVGFKRHLGCEIARGGMIMQWDDDDWHGPARISHQIAPILAETAEISGLGDALFLQALTGRFFTCDRPDDILYLEVIGGTLAFRKDTWARTGGYPDQSVGEDTTFLQRAVDDGAGLLALPNDDTFIVVRHSGNTWHLQGDELEPDQGWRETPPPGCLDLDSVRFYASLRSVRPRAAERSALPQ